MPTTAVGLIVFVILLAPGLSHSAYRTVNGPIRKPSPLRELGGIALRSVVCDVFALGAFGLVRIVLPSHTPDVGRLARDPVSYLRADLAYLFWWAVALLALACAAAIGTARFAGSTSAQRLAEGAPFRWFPSRRKAAVDTAYHLPIADGIRSHRPRRRRGSDQCPANPVPDGLLPRTRTGRGGGAGGLTGRQLLASLASCSARSVRSQLKSASSRPKWP